MRSNHGYFIVGVRAKKQAARVVVIFQDVNVVTKWQVAVLLFSRILVTEILSITSQFSRGAVCDQS